MDYTPIWPGSSSFATGSTPFGFFDNETQFQSDADKVADYCARRLGYPVVDVELQDIHFYTCFEEAVVEYSSQVNQYNIQQNLLTLIGTPTASNLTHQNVTPNFGAIIDVSNEYGNETGVGGNVNHYTASIDIEQNKQIYDLDVLVRDIFVPTGSISITRVHHYAPPAALRFYDPYLGNQAMLDTFGFGAYSTGVSFTLMPMYADLLRVQAIEFNDMMRKSSYSFELVNNKLRIFPIPIKNFKLFVEYIIKEERANPVKTPQGVVSDMSNAPYDVMKYSDINSVGKRWIYAYCLASAKESLGAIRSKYQSIPIPNGETSLDGGELKSEGAAEKQALIQELRTMLESMTRTKLLEAKRAESENLSSTLNYVPLKIYIG
ncbi:hypothetical protein [Microcystis phage Mel-JY01]